MAVPCVSAQGAGTVRLISAAELAKSFAKYRVLDAREAKEFERGHVPGSTRVDWKDWSQQRPDLWHGLFGDVKKWGKIIDDPREIGERLSALGLANDTPVAVVGQPYGWGEEGRIAWSLLYWGASEVALLDGGFAAWVKEVGKVEPGPGGTPPHADFRPRLRPSRRALLSEVAAAVREKRSGLLDSRSPEEYRGEKISGQKRGGRLPGARLVPVKALYREDGRYVDKETLRSLVGSSLDRPISYCVGGVRSALLALLVESRLGVVVANYDGSIWEWAAHPDLPLEK